MKKFLDYNLFDVIPVGALLLIIGIGIAVYFGMWLTRRKRNSGD